MARPGAGEYPKRHYGCAVSSRPTSVVHRELGLTDEEAQRIVEILGREPNHLELAMYAVMWSEHCSYKSSRRHLARLPTDAPWVLVGPGENAGVIDAGHGVAVALRIESHNHPSAVEPAQGAATGVGGILRDIFTMGARPIALMDPLRFGPLDDATSRWHVEGVVRGISGYGNAVGVPTVGGEVCFDECYSDNPLVNVLCVGVLPTERLVLGQASGVGNLAVLLGSTTGRDGIGGVSVLASAGFGDAELDASKRPNVQVGDPYEEKRLIEACLALIDAGVVVGIQDLGGAGLTCATSETASRGGVGMDVDLSAIALREPRMEPFEIMTSESQERMLAIVTPADIEAVRAICDRWEVRHAVVGVVTDSGQLRILDRRGGEVLADIPAASLHTDAPNYDRPIAPRPRSEPHEATRSAEADRTPAPASTTAGLIVDVLRSNVWVSSQYDHQLFLNTVAGPGYDAALLRLHAPGVPAHPGAIALSTDGNGRWCSVDPRRATAALVAESALNVACVGATARAVVNCLNFGNPEHGEVMWELSEAIDGMADACRALGLPVVGGNVSLYNESRGRDIDPTPVVAVLGVLDELVSRPPPPQLVSGARVFVVGVNRPTSLAGSLWADRHGDRGGDFPAVDWEAHAALLAWVVATVGAQAVSGIHDVADGGLALALAEMAAQGRCGLSSDVLAQATTAELFSEAPSRVVVVVEQSRADDVIATVPQPLLVWDVGTAGGDVLRVGDAQLEVAALRDRFDHALATAIDAEER